ncbi:MAG: (2Fe-2S)-binding protein [Planctomycetales bacterium]
MELEDELCLCFHVSKRKVVNFIRVEKPRAASQLSECFGAGTGCGWCRSYMTHLFESMAHGDKKSEEPTAKQHAEGRGHFVRDGGGTPPPGATPVS